MSANGIPSTSRERLTSPLTWHFVGFAVLLVLAVIGLAVRLGFDWAAIEQPFQRRPRRQADSSSRLSRSRPLLSAASTSGSSRRAIRSTAFYKKRIPSNYSVISSRIGELAVTSGVRLSRVGYTQGKPGADLTEISMDAGISGDYPAIMHFINALERDQIFFVIRAMSLTGQQGGLVNLRLRVSTWLRPADAEASGLPMAPSRAANLRLHPSCGKEGE